MATKEIALAIALTGSTLNAAAQPQISDYRLVNPSVVSGAQSVCTGDLNGDGRSDVLVQTTSELQGPVGSRLIWFPNLGSGAMGPAQELLRGESLRGHDVADLDADGDLDVLVSSVEGLTPQLFTLENQGDGTFDTTSELFASFGHLELKDLDQDGRLDLIVKSVGPTQVHFGVAGGGFDGGQGLAIGAFGEAASTSFDANGDGLLDILTEVYVQSGPTTGDFALLLFIQTPNRAFDPGVIVQGGLPTTAPLASLDVDLDGRDDIIRSSSGGLTWARSLGAGAFALLQVLPGFPSDLAELYPMDLDFDGDDDLIYVRNGGLGQRLLGDAINESSGLVPGEQLTTTLPIGAFAAADLNGDGWVDPVWVTLLQATLLTSARRSGLPYGQPVELSDRVSGPGVVGDLNGDGQLDVVTGTDGPYRYFERTSAATFARSEPVTIGGSGIIAPLIEDFDGDGFDDLLMGRQETSANVAAITLARGSSSGLGPALDVLTFPSAEFMSEVAAVDVDRDGDLDLTFCTFDLGLVTVHENLGGGAFGPRQVIDTLALSSVALAEDLSGDSVAELVVLEDAYGTPTIYLYPGAPGGGFGPRRRVGTETTDTSMIESMDVDLDGDQDLLRLTGDTSNVSLLWYENLGSLQFAPSRVLMQWSGSINNIEMCVADWNQDGQADLVFSNRFPRTLTWREVTSSGQLGPESSITSRFRSAESLVVLDLDGDQDLDLMVTDQPAEALRWFENLRDISATFCSSTANSTGEEALLSVSGSDFAALNRLALNVRCLPNQTFGIFVVSDTPDFVPQPNGSAGNLCLGGSIGRYVQPGQIQSSGGAGAFSLTLDLRTTPTSTNTVSVMSGQSFFYQAWYRDVAGGLATSNFSSGSRVDFR